MSVEEEIELRDLVAQTLETNGCLAKIRAQLRASIFLALDEDVKISQHQPLMNKKVKTHLESGEGQIMFCVVREFLEFFNLYFTMSVFDPESYMGSVYKYEGRQKVAEDLGIDDSNESTVPLLLKLIRIAQTKVKNSQIDLSVNEDDLEENKSLTQDKISNFNKTDSDNMFLKETDVNGESNKLLKNASPVLNGLNTTFNVNSPTININIANINESNTKVTSRIDKDSKDQLLDCVNNKKEEKDDDTYGDTSSIAEDSIAQINSEKSILLPEFNWNGIGEKVLINDSMKDGEVSQPLQPEHKGTDKSKLSLQISEKMISKGSLNSLTDLPPLQMNKSRVNDMLPSLYSKEFKEKSNLRELDKLFDMEAEYEEDFMCSGDDLSLKSDFGKSDHSKLNMLDDSQLASKSDKSFVGKRDLKQKVPNKIISDCNKQMFRPLVNSSRAKESLRTVGTSKKESSDSSANDNLNVNSSDSEHK